METLGEDLEVFESWMGGSEEKEKMRGGEVSWWEVYLPLMHVDMLPSCDSQWVLTFGNIGCGGGGAACCGGFLVL